MEKRIDPDQADLGLHCLLMRSLPLLRILNVPASPLPLPNQSASPTLPRIYIAHVQPDISLGCLNILYKSCNMADGISFAVSLSLNCKDLYKREGGAQKPDSNFQILEVRVRSVRSALFIHRKWLLHHRKVTMYSCNLNIGMEHKHTVQTQIRLCRPKLAGSI